MLVYSVWINCCIWIHRGMVTHILSQNPFRHLHKDISSTNANLLWIGPRFAVKFDWLKFSSSPKMRLECVSRWRPFCPWSLICSLFHDKIFGVWLCVCLNVYWGCHENVRGKLWQSFITNWKYLTGILIINLISLKSTWGNHDKICNWCEEHMNKHAL